MVFWFPWFQTTVFQTVSHIGCQLIDCQRDERGEDQLSKSPPPPIHGGFIQKDTNLSIVIKRLYGIQIISRRVRCPQTQPSYCTAQINDWYRALTELVQHSAYRGPYVGSMSLVVIQYIQYSLGSEGVVYLLKLFLSVLEAAPEEGGGDGNLCLTAV